MATTAPSDHHGGITIFYSKADQFAIKRAPPPWAECHQIPAGDGAAAACRGVVYLPQKRLNHIVC